MDEYAPDDWNYERDGRPDIIFWIHNGESAEQIAKTLGAREMPDLSHLPLMDYEEAAKYRDGLLANRNETLTSSAITSFDTGDVFSKSGTVSSIKEENTSGGGGALLNARNNDPGTIGDDSENLGIVNKTVSDTLNGMKRFGRSFYRKVVSGTQETERAAKAFPAWLPLFCRYRDFFAASFLFPEKEKKKVESRKRKEEEKKRTPQKTAPKASILWQTRVGTQHVVDRGSTHSDTPGNSVFP